MVNEIKENNLFLINAPAGSGKTTRIKEKIIDIIHRDKNSNILCITYTNRSADELLKGIDSNNIEIKTIHSFFATFMEIYFSHQEILDLYFDVYGEIIKKRIKNEKDDPHIEESNNRYKNRYGDLNYEIVKANIKKIQYNETPTNSIYYGGLSHDDLIYFSKLIIDRFQNIRNRLKQKYQYIFIDEYQDTNSIVLKIFYNTIKDSTSKLYLFGDRMQQIYKNYDGSFEQEFLEFDQSYKLRINYRSTKYIIDILNSIYNDPNFEQKPSKEDICSIKPIAFISSDVEKSKSEIIEINPSILQLVLLNQSKFQSIGSDNIFNNINRMNKYKFGSKYNAVDILSTKEDNPDGLFNLLFFFYDLFEKYNLEDYGSVIQSINKKSIINNKILNINYHDDKKKLNKKLINIFAYFKSTCDKTIKDLLYELIKEEIVFKEKVDYLIDDEDYDNVLNTSMKEFNNLYHYLKSPTVSTQHGVKGEGHDEVLFIAEDNNRLSVNMYGLFQLMTEINISLPLFEDYFYSFLNIITEFETKIGFKIKDLNTSTFKDYKDNIDEIINKIHTIFEKSEYYVHISYGLYQRYKSSSNVTNCKRLLNTNNIYNLLNAYKIFYVGCSRAKKKLLILIDTNRITEFQEKLINKFKNIGFYVINTDIVNLQNISKYIFENRKSSPYYHEAKIFVTDMIEVGASIEEINKDLEFYKSRIDDEEYYNLIEFAKLIEN